jgi:hypothetical protein
MSRKRSQNESLCERIVKGFAGNVGVEKADGKLVFSRNRWSEESIGWTSVDRMLPEVL